MNNYPQIQELLQQRADLLARLHLLPYDGTPEIKENQSGKYLYIRKRVGSRLTSTYVDVYSEELYQLLLRNNREAREFKKQIRKIEKQLAELGFADSDLSDDVMLNLDFARANMKLSIYEQAVLEGVATTFPQTEDIIENGTVNGVTAYDVQKILNLKHAWEFILDKDVLQVPSDYSVLCHIAKLVNEGFFANGGRIRGVPVSIGGTTYKPPIPDETNVMEDLKNIALHEADKLDIAIELCLYCMKKQIFNDGNKRAAVIFANHYLIANAGGLLVIPEVNVPEFKKLLVQYYEDKDNGELKEFLKRNCHKAYVAP
ncbi:MAG: cell filamentation protein Fic [Ruminococcaceae bacterium]|nr:cell filamentation protein Fic [Oscillospiraceae bacterium]